MPNTVLRFATPPGWPPPAPDWVEQHEGIEPAPGWVPMPGSPPAPAGWRFWRLPAAALRDVPAPVGPSLRRARRATVVGLPLAALGVVVTVLLALFHGPSALGLVLVVAGVALGVVGSVRSTDLLRRAIAEAVERAGSRRATVDHLAEWGVPDALPFVPATSGADRTTRDVTRAGRLAVGLTAGAAAIVLLAGAGISSAPVVQSAARTFGAGVSHGLQAAGPDGGDDGGDDSGEDTPPYVSDDGTLTVSQPEDDDSWDTACSATPGDTDCWVWRLTSAEDCDAVVTIGFADAEYGDDDRSVVRRVHVTADVPLLIGELGDESYAGIDEAHCDTTAPHRVIASEHTIASDSSAWPDACDDLGCIGWRLLPEEDCAEASVLVDLPDGYAGNTDTTDVLVTVPFRNGRHVDVFVADVEDDDGTAAIDGITCGSSAAGGPTDAPSDGSEGADA